MQTPDQKKLAEQQAATRDIPPLQGSLGGTGAEAIGGKATPAAVNTAISSGGPIDNVGGAGMGLPPGEGDVETRTGQPAEKRAADLQDRRNDGG